MHPRPGWEGSRRGVPERVWEAASNKNPVSSGERRSIFSSQNHHEYLRRLLSRAWGIYAEWMGTKSHALEGDWAYPSLTLQVLTDNVCSKCGKVPLMRSPSGPIIYFCANCDGSPSRVSQHVSQPSHSAASSHRTATIPSPRSGSSYDSSSHGASRPSTPPTELYSQLSSPAFAPEDTEEILRRREQSEQASTEIGKLLLKGWTMLADECPNPQCYGIPLVRPPKGDKDPRKVSR